MTTELDLSQLAIDRDTQRPLAGTHRRRWLSRYAVPGSVLLGFLALLAWAVRDRLLPSTPVTVIPVMVTRAAAHAVGTPLFHAAGWVEPRPTPVLTPALTDGIVAELLVVEGQEVESGQPVARLIDTDAHLALEQAQADLDLRTAELESAQAELRAARLRREQPVHLEAHVAEAHSLLAKTETERAGMPFLIQAAEARLEYTRQSLSGKQAAEPAISRRVLLEAQSDFDRAQAELQELQARKLGLERESDALRQRHGALARQLELLIDETRHEADAQAQVHAAEARRRQAELSVQAAQLRLQRMVVTAPVSGRVLSLVARPGSRVTGPDRNEEHSGSTVVTLYDPHRLQVRADVRLEDVPLIQPGQAVQIETASVREPIRGEVLLATSQASVQKNTLEVKVALVAPPPEVRPEMLVKATFLAVDKEGEPSRDFQPAERLLVPRQLVEAAANGPTVWVADPSGRADRRPVQLGKAVTAELVEVVAGLSATDRLIAEGRQGLISGQRITIAGDDPGIGIVASTGRNSFDK